MNGNIEKLIQSIKSLHDNLSLNKTIATGMFMPNGVRFSKDDDEAMLRARIQSSRNNQPFAENNDANLDEIDDQVINKMIDDMLNT